MNQAPTIEDLSLIANRLKDYRDRCDELLAILNGDAHSQESMERARSAYTSLKNDLKTEARNALKDPAIHAGAASAFLEPAVNGAALQLHPATNSNPTNAGWAEAVYGARIDITYYLNQIRL